MIKATKPYAEGTRELWELHQLDIIDKHRVLLVMASAASTERMRIAIGDRAYEVPVPPNVVYPVEDGTVLGRIGPQASSDGADPEKMLVHPEVTFEVTLREIGVVEGKALAPSLYRYAKLVEGIICRFQYMPCGRSRV
jgi:hypothetical protein